MRVLLACRDAGAARQLCAVAQALASEGPHGEHAVGVLAEGAARGVFDAERLRYVPLQWDDAAGITTQLQTFAPHVVLTGVSAPGSTIDAVVTRQAREFGTPVLGFQDYWGCCHDDPLVQPSEWLVLDDEAARLTLRQHPTTPCHVVGSPRHDALAHREFAPLQHAATRRREHGAPMAVVFAGQPLWHLPAYAATLDATASALQRLGRPVQLRYAPHPAEGDVSAQVARCFGRDQALALETRGIRDLVAELCDTDMLLTAFSTCAWDLLQMHRWACTPPAVPLCLMWEPGIQEAHARYGAGRHTVPYEALLGDFLVCAHEALAPTLDAAWQPRARNAITSRVRAGLPPTIESATAKVITALQRAARAE